jgi:CubicO group peptidase (beta-lactamase class C family)
VDRLVSAIEQQLAGGVVGIAGAVVVGHEIVWSGGFGVLDVERRQPVTAASSFPIQSVTKSLVATALMHWIEQGVVALDDPVNRHLYPVTVGNPWELSSPITIRQLFTHTAGLPATMGMSSAASLPETVAHEVAAVNEPGTTMVYANTGYDVLGYLLQRLSDTSWDAAVRDTVLAPLGMSTTGIDASSSSEHEQATGHLWSMLDTSPLPVEPPPLTYAQPSGSMVSTADDLARFVVALLNGGGGVVETASVADMQRVHAPLGAGSGGMGLGFRVDRRGERRFFCHGGDGVGFTTFIGGHPDERVGVVLLMNTGGAQEARSVLVRTALECGLGGVSSAPNGRTSSPLVQGAYRSTFWNVRAEITDPNGSRQLTVPAGTVSFSESVSRLLPAGPRWLADGGMFDGWELEVATQSDGRSCFFGGVYPFEFVADDSPIVRMPTTVDVAGEVAGAWMGTADTPFGDLPLEVEVRGGQSVSVTLMGLAASDEHADATAGWVRGEVLFDYPGVGAVRVFLKLGLVARRLEGFLYARTDLGEFAIPSVLTRRPSPTG